MRGTHAAKLKSIRESGIIPAYAGNTVIPAAELKGMRGSSPRMRGTQRWVTHEVLPAGIIPAYAGNTASETWRQRRGWDHPRVCGEHIGLIACPAIATGSSPRMRGTPLLLVGLQRRRGIIPAYAGNTCRAMRTIARSRSPREQAIWRC